MIWRKVYLCLVKMLSIQPMKAHAKIPIALIWLCSDIIPRAPTTSIQKENLLSVEGRTRIKYIEIMMAQINIIALRLPF